MKITETHISEIKGLWKVTITDGNGLKVHIDGCETQEIAQKQADDRIRELKRGGLL